MVWQGKSLVGKALHVASQLMLKDKLNAECHDGLFCV